MQAALRIPQETAFFNDLNNQVLITIQSVTVNGATATNPTPGSDATVHLGPQDSGLTVKFFANGQAEVDGLHEKDLVEFRTGNDQMDRFTVTNVTPQTNRSFDIGNIVSLGTTSAHADATPNVVFEDDGPTASIALAGGTVTHDELSGPQTAGGATDTKDATVVALFTNVSNPSQDFVTDDPTGNIYAQSATAVVNSTGSSSGADLVGATTKFSLSVSSPGVDSLLQTTDGTEIFLFLEDGLVVGRTGAANGEAAFAVAIDPSTGSSVPRNTPR